MATIYSPYLAADDCNIKGYATGCSAANILQQRELTPKGSMTLLRMCSDVGRRGPATDVHTTVQDGVQDGGSGRRFRTKVHGRGSAIARVHAAGSVTPSLTITSTRDSDARPRRARASASESSRVNASRPPSAAAPEAPAVIVGSAPTGRPRARIAASDHTSSMARNASTIGNNASNAGGDTSRFRSPAIVVVRGPVTVTGWPARAEACKHAAVVGSTANTRGGFSRR